MTATESLLLAYCDLLGDYFIFRPVMQAIIPLLKQRFDKVIWACNPSVAQLSSTLDPDWQPFIQLRPVAPTDWTRLTLKRSPKLLFQRQALLSQLDAHKLPHKAKQVWCPSVAPFEDNVINALIKAPRKLGRRLESWNLDLLQRLIFTETLAVPDFKQFMLSQHQAFFTQALQTALPSVTLQPITHLPAACFHPLWIDRHSADPYVVIFPESAGAYKEWPPAAFAQCITTVLAQRPALSVVLAGQKPDLAQAIMTQIPDTRRVVDLVGQTTVVQTLGLIQGSALVVCNDSYPLHAANALGRPFVCITNGQFQGRYYPYPDQYRFSTHQFVGLQQADGRLDSIPVTHVLDAVLGVLPHAPIPV
jgi:ADP-heptose:LPS heptosyltransferase